MEVLVLAFVAVIIGFIVIGLNRRPPVYLPMIGDGHPALDEHAGALEKLNMEAFEALCLKLVAHMGLDVESVDHVESDEIEIRANDPKPVVGGLYILIGVLRGAEGLVGPTSVSNLYSVVKDEHAQGGILVTNGLFAVPAATMLYADKLQLINGASLLEVLGADALPKPN